MPPCRYRYAGTLARHFFSLDHAYSFFIFYLFIFIFLLLKVAQPCRYPRYRLQIGLAIEVSQTICLASSSRSHQREQTACCSMLIWCTSRRYIAGAVNPVHPIRAALTCSLQLREVFVANRSLCLTPSIIELAKASRVKVIETGFPHQCINRIQRKLNSNLPCDLLARCEGDLEIEGLVMQLWLSSKHRQQKARRPRCKPHQEKPKSWIISVLLRTVTTVAEQIFRMQQENFQLRRQCGTS